ncbi:MAG: 1-deoxy-D-xylulose-5-phosphate reductoisomerase [Candidatus Omnitrophica bacterium]|nr:1-deoxy-D-xylulose-5-phosphate reductoisomerase [Candidatus Omnitrophota bacterium]
MKTLSLLGSTGFIGRGVLKVVEAFPDRFKVEALAARSNSELLYEQAIRFHPRVVCIFDAVKARELESKLRPKRVKVVTGGDGLRELASLKCAQMAVFALVGINGLHALIDAIRHHKEIAIANKELLVMAGRIIRDLAKRNNVKLIPIDSEHSAVWQCLEGQRRNELKRLVLTASGGPFLGWTRKRLAHVTPRKALRHPRWRMGRKITVDSATLMNKGFEVIEACTLFGVRADKVEVLLHPEAVAHSMVEFIDGSVLAQLSATDMRIPIQYALTYPERLASGFAPLDLGCLGPLNFKKPLKGEFPCLDLAYEAERRGGVLPAVLNAADEVLVDRFLRGKISFLKIPALLSRVIAKAKTVKNPALREILLADRWAREEAARLC